MQEKFTKLNILIKESKNILLITHPKPDGDALGSICALIGFLKAQSKNFRAFCADSVPTDFTYLPWQEEIINNLTDLADFKPDLVIVLDLWDWPRAGLSSYLKRLTRPSFKLFIIDHHIPGEVQAGESLIDTKYSSTSEIIYHFFKSINWLPDKQIASALLTGLLTDTENFTNQATEAVTLQRAGELVRLGANLNKISQIIWRSRKFKDLKLIGLVLDRLNINQNYGLAVTIVRQSDFEQFGEADEDSLGLSNFLKGLFEGRAVLVLTEKDNEIKGSLRSISEDVDVARLAKLLGGGGHKLAAGFSLPGKLIKSNGHWQVL